MSNLHLPSLRYADLASRKSGTLAYATTVAVMPGTGVAIMHHGSCIATMREDGHGGLTITIDTCGWDSKTTTMRLDRILLDNGIPKRVAIRKGEACLLNSDLSIAARGLTKATFVKSEPLAAWGWEIESWGNAPYRSTEAVTL